MKLFSPDAPLITARFARPLLWVGLLQLGLPARERPAPVTIDFSHAGYGGGGVAVPSVPTRLRLVPSGGDDTASIQAAIDEVSARKANPDGFSGAVQLEPGVFHVAGHVGLHASGVVLRGSADPQRPSVIVATGRGRRTLIEIQGRFDRVLGPPHLITVEAVPAGSLNLPLDNVDGLSIGDRIVIIRPSTAAWLAELEMGIPPKNYERALQWLPGSRNIEWSRKIVAIDRARLALQLDAPITTALQRKFGGGVAHKVSWPGLLRHAGIEDLVLVSDYDRARPRDEDHAWLAVSIDRAEDIWVRRVTTRYFCGSAVWVGRHAGRVTIADCNATEPISEPAGYRRMSFYVDGQQVLTLRCRADQGWNDFASGLCAAGPNVFLDCIAARAQGASGSLEGWASGILYENVTVQGQGLTLSKDFSRAQGAGWTAANSVLWNCQASPLLVDSPPDGENQVRVDSDSLYRAQLAARAAAGALSALDPAPSGSSEADEFRPPARISPPTDLPAPPLVFVNGRFVIGGRVVWGSALGTAWWRGSIVPEAAPLLGVGITRFTPGHNGRGMMEDLPALAGDLATAGISYFQHWPGLWYDRRQDEHSLLPRDNADVWPPFFEMPWRRSGAGVARDKLSQYDLTQFNPWYFDRLREFANICGRRELIFSHDFYNHHNFQENLAHWMDFPWRPMNALQETGIPEPQPEEWLKRRFHLANTFYDISDPQRRALHRAYIEHGLEALKDCPNVIHGVGFQYSGPLAFQQFFLDTVAEWALAHHQTVKVSLTTSKDVTDAILADPIRSKIISIIDIRYWQYLPDGTLFAPPGGKNLAFREMTRDKFGQSAGDTPPFATPYQTYRMIREYRDRYPGKVIVGYSSDHGPIPVLMAGGAQAIPLKNGGFETIQAAAIEKPFTEFVRRYLSRELPMMSPLEALLDNPTDNWCLADPGRTYLIYSLADFAIAFAGSLPVAEYTGVWFDPLNGTLRPAQLDGATRIKGGTILKPSDQAWLLLLKKHSSEL